MEIRIIDQTTFCFIFSIPSSFLKAWGSSCPGYFEIFRKLLGKNNMMEFMFSNAVGKHRKGYFLIIFWNY